MNTEVASHTNSVSSIVSSGEETDHLDNSVPSVNKQSESDETIENGQSYSSLEVNVSPLETEISTGTSNGGQNTESINEDRTHESVDDEKEEEEEEEEEWLDVLGSGQLKKKILKRAENSYKPQLSQICEVNIEGCLPDGTVVEKLSNASIQIGDAEIVQGLDLALPMMEVGEVALVEVGPRFAYGSLGRSDDVPANATITYTVELLSAEQEPDMESLPIMKRREIGCRKRERGNWWYTRQEHSLAIQCYRRALDYLDDAGGIAPKAEDSSNSEQDSEREMRELMEDRLKVYNNLTAAQMKIKAFDAALQSVENVLRCQPHNVKALFRKGKILSARGETSSAVAVLRLASQLEPENRMIKQELVKMLTVHKEDTMQEKNLYKKMLGQDKQPDSLPKNNKFQIPWGLLFGTLAVMVAGMVAYRYKFL